MRPPSVAGTFYPRDVQQLDQLIDTLTPHCDEQPAFWPAAMVPHAGLKYSGQVAVSVFQRILLPDDVIIICPKHTRFGVNWAVAPHEAWSIPGATISGNRQLAQRLVDEIPGMHLDAAAHQTEHAIEVELPFIARYSRQTRVVGMASGACKLEQALGIGEYLARIVASLERPPMLLISSDMHHFGTDEENRRLDRMALQAMAQLDPVHLYETVIGNRITMCGIVPAVIVMQALRTLGRLDQFRQIAYATSGDVSGDRSRVVGYAGALLG